MKPCSDYQAMLLLDVYGELNPAERRAWENHLSTCEHCRKEKEQLLQLLQTIKTALPAPTLSPDKIAEHVRSIQWKLREEANLPWWRKVRFHLPYRLVPALTTACLLLIIASWFGVKEFRKVGLLPTSPQTTSEEQINRNDLEVVENLDFLKEMEDVKKLVKHLDETDSQSPSTQTENNINDGGDDA
jgi:predicted anti-sigma-YlaC factor YlaD